MNENGKNSNINPQRSRTVVTPEETKRPQAVHRPESVGQNAPKRPYVRPQAVRSPNASDAHTEGARAPVYGSENISRPIVRNRKKKSTTKKVLITVAVLAAVLAALTLLVIYLIGIRYLKYPFIEEQTGKEYMIRYIGTLDDYKDPLRGTIYYPDGTKATLDFSGSNEKVIYKNEDIYEGKLYHLQKHGKGILTLSNGDKYEGEFSYNEFSGTGVYTYASGDVYDGNFLNGKKSGNGTYTWAPGSDGKSDIYVGSFSDDMRNGKGTFSYADGSVYEGNFTNDKKNDESGTLKIALEDGTFEIYIGAFVNDLREGHGVYTWPNGEVFDGEFKNNLISGYGTYKWPNGRTYTGNFENGQIVTDSGNTTDSGSATNSDTK